MLTSTLKNIPEELYARLKQSAEKNHRSLNSEILTRLDSDFAAPVIDFAARELTQRAFVAKLPEVDHSRVNRYKRRSRP